MELGRWGQRQIQSFASTSKSLIEFIEDALEADVAWGPGAPGPASSSQERFVSRDDMGAIEVALSGAEQIDQAFDVMIPFFEAGFWLRRLSTGDEWRARRMFILGQSFWPEDESMSLSLQLPALTPLGTLKGRGRAVLRAFGLDSVARLRDSTAFVFAPSEADVFVALTERGEPWAIDLIEAASRGFARRVGAPSPSKARRRAF